MNQFATGQVTETVETGQTMEIVKWPAWFYGPDGQSAVFESPDEVPEGWEDHPSKVSGDVADEDISNLTKKQISERLTEAEIEHDPNWTKDKLVALLQEYIDGLE
jgi:hypothetical protein